MDTSSVIITRELSGSGRVVAQVRCGSCLQLSVFEQSCANSNVHTCQQQEHMLASYYSNYSNCYSLPEMVTALSPDRCRKVTSLFQRRRCHSLCSACITSKNGRTARPARGCGPHRQVEPSHVYKHVDTHQKNLCSRKTCQQDLLLACNPIGLYTSCQRSTARAVCICSITPVNKNEGSVSSMRATGGTGAQHRYSKPRSTRL